MEGASAPAGVRLSALKFTQRAMLVQTRGVTDPRVSRQSRPTVDCVLTSFVVLQLQNKADPNLSFCPSDHPYISVTALEAEGGQFLTMIITLLYNSQYVISDFCLRRRGREPMLRFSNASQKPRYYFRDSEHLWRVGQATPCIRSDSCSNLDSVDTCQTCWPICVQHQKR